MGCVDALLKYVVFLFDFVFLVVGAALVVAGIYIQVEYQQYLEFLGDKLYLDASIILIIVGAILLIMALMGCVGLRSQNHCLVRMHTILASVVVILEIGGGLTAYFLANDIYDKLAEGMQNGMRHYGQHRATMAWDFMQSEFSCCGVEQYRSDWAATRFGRLGDVPDSCCKVETDKCGAVGFAPAAMNGTGCLEKAENIFTKHWLVVVGIAAGVVIVQIFGIAMTRYLSKKYIAQKTAARNNTYNYV